MAALDGLATRSDERRREPPPHPSRLSRQAMDWDDVRVFLAALKQAGFFARTIVVPGAGHFWASEPVDEPSSFGAYTAPKILRFLQTAL